MTAKRLGFFTRLLDQTDAGGRYNLATEQIVRAEQLGFQSAWVAQHHFLEAEGGLPSPFVLLAHVAARTSSIRLGTGVVTLPLEEPLRTAEDAAVFDLLTDGRLELGVGSGGNPFAFAPFGLDNAKRTDVYISHLRTLRAALRGDAIDGSEARLYPTRPELLDRMWQATFSADGGRWAGMEGDGLMLSRTQPRPTAAPGATLADIQMPIVDAYMAALPAGRAPRILGSRALFVAERLKAMGRAVKAETLDQLITSTDTHVGTPEEVIASLRADRTLEMVTDLVFQVHSVDPPHALILRSLELIAEQVAPALGWKKPAAADRALEAAL